MQKVITVIALSFVAIMIIFCLPDARNSNKLASNLVPGIEKSIVDRAENSKDRQEHFFRLTKNPVTKKIPNNIRSRELAHADFLESNFNYKNKSIAEEISIVEAGPNDVGGRTRGFGVDSRDSDILLSGGASGGMWKSTDGGDSWFVTSELGQNLGVTSLVQDPNNLDTWFYSTGEFTGASSRARGGGGTYYGSGIYISNDNGDSWSQIQATADNNVLFDSEFDFISRVAINPISGTKFFASNALGIFRSENNFVTNTNVLGEPNKQIYSDVQVGSNGNVIAAISRPFSGQTQTISPGVYISTNDGVNWTDITPSSYPSAPGRAVIGVSPSEPDKFYVFTAGNSNDPVLHFFDVSDINNVITSDRTDNIPNFGPPVGNLNLQGGYNMVCEVHPTDSDILVIGGTNLYRSLDGFSTAPTDEKDQDGNSGSDGFTDSDQTSKYWIGGYARANNVSQYSGHHPDQHVVVFDPNDSNRIFSTHDGGISVASNINASSIFWRDLNNGYNVTQFYTVSLHPDFGDNRVVGGTQDNGSPFFRYDNITGTGQSIDPSSGDGAYQYLGTNYFTTSSQNGRLIKYNYTALGDPTSFSYISPLNASNQLFIHPYLVNHTNEDILFYPGGRKLYRNNSVTTLTRNTDNPDGINEGWTELTEFSGTPGSLISTLAISTTNPSDVLYYAIYSEFSAPKIYKVNNASSTTTENDLNIIEITSANSDSLPPAGAYIHDIAISEDNGNEIMAVISNYETESIYYSTDGGSTWTGSGGNLEPENGNGPSVRTAAITKTNTGEKTYFVGTSTGLYATNELDGANTEWKFQGANTVGNTVVEFLDYRPSDKTLAIATHGRGIFLGNTSTSVSNEVLITDVPDIYDLKQNYPNPFNPSTNISYSLPSNSTVSITIYDINGRKVAELLRNENKSAGSHTSSFNASSLASGVYLYRIDAKSKSKNQSYTQTKRMTLIK